MHQLFDGSSGRFAFVLGDYGDDADVRDALAGKAAPFQGAGVKFDAVKHLPLPISRSSSHNSAVPDENPAASVEPEFAPTPSKSINLPLHVPQRTFVSPRQSSVKKAKYEAPDDMKRQNYVLDVLRHLKMTRRDLAKKAGVADFTQMNYWLRGKDITFAQVSEIGAVVYQWAQTADPRETGSESLRCEEEDEDDNEESYPPPLEAESSQDSAASLKHLHHHQQHLAHLAHAAEYSKQRPGIMPISPQRDEPLSPVRSSVPTPMHTPGHDRIQAKGALFSPSFIAATSEILADGLTSTPVHYKSFTPFKPLTVASSARKLFKEG